MFLTRPARLDRSALRRMAHLVALDKTVVMPLRGLSRGERNFLSLKKTGPFDGINPFLRIPGLDMALSGPMLRHIGGLDPGFTHTFEAGRELGYRAWISGARFVPVTLPCFPEQDGSAAPETDGMRLRRLCPVTTDDTPAQAQGTPRIAVCIGMPIIGTPRDLLRSLVALQRHGPRDIEICVAHSGRAGRLRRALPRRLRNDLRLQFLPSPVAPLGALLNRACAGSRAPLLLPLGLGDRPGPGMIARLLASLDEGPDAAAAICPAAGAQPVQPERQKLLSKPSGPHGLLIRRGAWARAGGWDSRVETASAGFRDMLLKLSLQGPVSSEPQVWFRPGPAWTVDSGTEDLALRRAALERSGQSRYYALQPAKAGRFDLVRRDVPLMMVWPVVRSNPYQRLLYASATQGIEICEGDIDAALAAIEAQSAPVIFHLHWTAEFWRNAADETEARRRVDSFLDRLSEFRHRGGRIVWTLHNVISHDSRFPSLEIALSRQLVELAHRLHLHSEGSVPEIEKTFALPRKKIRISRHGSYRGAYPDFVSRRAAREALELDEADDVILFTGQLRGYKGVETLISAFRDILARHPRALLLIAGDVKTDPFTDLVPALSEAERARIRVTGRFIGDMELQLYFRAADVAVYPYRQILTSGSLLLAISFGVPVVIPEVGMTREVLGGRDAGVLYDGEAGEAALIAALEQILARKRAGSLNAMGQAAEALADELDWPDFRDTVLNEQDGTWT
ncbi:glycosyltransferase [Limimaricola sp. AA108-03]|uniref:glycosyltransferase n=1 Tax=Limimaricola sp. AA108-03 TaxID=3425945 RepID=UPI003D77FA51